MPPPALVQLPASGVPAAAARAPQRLIGPRSSLRSRGLNRLLRWLNGGPLRLYTDPDVSPLFADLRGLPPLLLQAGRSELLRDEAVRTADKAHAAGVAVELELWPDTAHGFQMAPFLPEAGLALDQIARFVRARAGW